MLRGLPRFRKIENEAGRFAVLVGTCRYRGVRLTFRACISHDPLDKERFMSQTPSHRYGVLLWMDCLLQLMEELMYVHGIEFSDEAFMLRSMINMIKPRLVMEAKDASWVEPTISGGPFSLFSLTASMCGKRIPSRFHPTYRLRQRLPFPDERAARACGRAIVRRLVLAFGNISPRRISRTPPMLTKEQKAVLERSVWEGILLPFHCLLINIGIELDRRDVCRFFGGHAPPPSVGDHRPGDARAAYIRAMLNEKRFLHPIGSA
jgi:hypothetical protein